MNILNIRDDFPLFRHKVDGQKLVYLDNAATTQKPQIVLDAIHEYYEFQNANIHRGAHYLSRLATYHYENARSEIAQMIGAQNPRELVFTSGTTAAINLVAQVLTSRFGPGDEILVTWDAHHSNIVPWQMLCQRTGAILRPIPLTENMELDIDMYASMLSPRAKLLAFPAISNSTGVIHPAKEMMRMARSQSPSCLCLVDGAQSIGYMQTNVSQLGCDFFVFSGHKIYSTTGTGVLWGREALLEELPPWQGGGEMIKEVHFASTTYNTLPFKYEAGTPDIEGNIALAVAMRYMHQLGMDKVRAHEDLLHRHLDEGLAQLPGVRVLGHGVPRGALSSIIIEKIHHYDLGMILDQMGIAVRTGHHCCQPLMQSLNISGTTRYSLAVYNTKEEIDIAIEGTARALRMLG